jgi:2-oxo-4-hydroxy-4-carboxy-5-ureidoimidazoline decarboxylase
MKNLSPDSLLAKFGGVYEHSAWITETLYDQKGRSGTEKPSELAGAMVKILASTPQDLQMALLRAHPELTGKLAWAGTLPPSSAFEELDAGLDQCNQTELDTFKNLNAHYHKSLDSLLL